MNRRPNLTEVIHPMDAPRDPVPQYRRPIPSWLVAGMLATGAIIAVLTFLGLMFIRLVISFVGAA